MEGTVTVSSGSAYFVGIAASAGGLEAASLLVQNLPKGANAVYVLAQHMSPTHKSLLTDLISRETSMPVVELADDVLPVPDTIYVTPPNKDVLLKDGLLCLRTPTGHPAVPKPSADRLFKSLAEECGEHSVAVVLSGTGSDGSYGVQSIREAGGITIAQETASAKYDGMPSAAIETGSIDLTLTPEQIGSHLTKILETPRNLQTLKHLNKSPSRLADIFQIILANTNVDFFDYKENTVNRRIARRMSALNIIDYEKYVAYCRETPAEVDALKRDLLISVTRFFRDPEQFEQLAGVLKSLVDTSSKEQLRLWVTGCATGEEAYTIAILMVEAIGGLHNLGNYNIQVFATDIDEEALMIARAGVYSLSALDDIPEDLAKKYFSTKGQSIVVSQAIKKLILFSKHNVAMDPPFLNIDLVSIRNLLIYFNTRLQEKVLDRLHYSISDGGLAFFGTSETPGSLRRRFEIVKGTDKIYRKISGALSGGRPEVPFPISRLPDMRTNMPTSVDATTIDGSSDLFLTLARSIAPNGFMVTRQNVLVRVFGNISPILELSEETGLRMTTRILRKDLRHEASGMIGAMAKSEKARIGRWHELVGPDYNQVRLRGYPINSSDADELLVLFALDFRQHEVNAGPEELTEADKSEYLRQMEAEVASTREALHHTVEELQTSNEELQAVNEELQSANEELQATNEELETSNEELQSTNEELITVNEELQVNSAELQVTMIELAAMLDNAEVPHLFVDPGLMIKRASQKAVEFFELTGVPAAGVHITQCRLPKDFPNLAKICADTFRLRQRQVIDWDTGTSGGSIIVAPLEDPQRKALGLQITVQSVELGHLASTPRVIEDMSDVAFWRIDLEDQRLHWSDGVFRIHGMSPDEGVPNVEEAIAVYHEDDRDMVAALVAGAVNRGEDFKFEARIIRKDGATVSVQSAGHVVKNTSGQPTHIVGAFREQSQRNDKDVQYSEFEQLQREMKVGFYSFDIHTRKPIWSPGMYSILGRDGAGPDPDVEDFNSIFHPEDLPEVQQKRQEAFRSGNSHEYEARILQLSGDIVRCSGVEQAHRREDGTVTHLFGHLRVIQND